MENFPYEFYYKYIGRALSRSKKYGLVIKYFTGDRESKKERGKSF